MNINIYTRDSRPKCAMLFGEEWVRPSRQHCTNGGQRGTYRKLVKPLKTPSGTLVSWFSDRERVLWAWQTWVDACICTLSQFTSISSACLALEWKLNQNTYRQTDRQIHLRESYAHTLTLTHKHTHARVGMANVGLISWEDIIHVDI